MGTPRVTAHGWVALLRGVNVGGKNIVPMAELRRVLEVAGAADVTTYIQSGNVVFAHESTDGAAVRELLETTIHAAFGVSCVVVLRTFPEFAKVARTKPFGADNSNTHVSFLERKPTAEGVRKVAKLEIGQDEIKIVGSEAYLHYPNGVSGSRLTGPMLERALGVSGTVRNWRTVTQLAAMASVANA